MMQAFFLWFYCLSISDAVFWVALVSAAYLILRQWLREKRVWRPLSVLLLLLWLAILTTATLTDRTPGTIPVEPAWVPFHSYREVLAGGNRELLRSNFMNVVLFYPAGLFFCEMLPRRWNRIKRIAFTSMVFAMMSVGIEVCQYYFALGKAEADDVLHNTLGAVLGAMVQTIRLNWSRMKNHIHQE